jgi:hypothetical protein
MKIGLAHMVIAAASDKVYQLLAHIRWFSAGTPASSTTKTNRHDIAEINQSINIFIILCLLYRIWASNWYTLSLAAASPVHLFL